MIEIIQNIISDKAVQSGLAAIILSIVFSLIGGIRNKNKINLNIEEIREKLIQAEIEINILKIEKKHHLKELEEQRAVINNLITILGIKDNVNLMEKSKNFENI